MSSRATLLALGGGRRDRVHRGARPARRRGARERRVLAVRLRAPVPGRPRAPRAPEPGEARPPALSPRAVGRRLLRRRPRALAPLDRGRWRRPSTVVANLLELRPEWLAHGWLFVLAVSGQVVGYLAIAASLPRLPAVVASILLHVQPVLTVILAALVVDERPSGVQVAGVLFVVAGIVVATSGGRREQEAGVPAEA